MTKALSLDRMAIEEAGPDPERLAQAIHQQLKPIAQPVPVVEIAHALDISEIRTAPLESFEGALLTTPERDIGSILVNTSSQAERRRFTIAHELGHYLNVRHKPQDERGFMCGKADLRFGRFVVKPGLTVHERQEFEANQFAIELLAPRKQIERLTSDQPSLADVLDIGSRFKLSKSAASRRYAELHHMPVAIVYTQYGKVRYHLRSKSCPIPRLRAGDRFVQQQASTGDNVHTHEIDVAVRQGAGSVRDVTVAAETLFQQQGYALTLLIFEPPHDNDGSD